MAFATHVYGTKAATDTMAVTFPYLSEDDVEVYVDDVLIATDKYEFTSPTLITCLTGFTEGDKTVVKRKSIPTTPPAVFSSPVFQYAFANLNATTLLYAIQENMDRDTEFPALRVDPITDDFEAGGVDIGGLAGPTADDHAARKKYVDDLITAETSTIAAYAADAESSAADAESAADDAAAAASSIEVDADAVAASASAASTSASNASSSASSAASSASAASSSASSASTSASSASTSATNASNSATSAGNAQTAAETAQGLAEDAQSAAEDAAADAEAAWDSIDDLYLGAKASDPTLDNDGDALQTGAIYYNSVSEVLRVYSGSAWETGVVAGTGLTDIVDDVTPQLGGDLDANGFDIDMGVNEITDTKVGQWDTAVGWGNHASAGYIAPTITSIASGELLKWNGSAWINNTLAEAGIAAASHTHATSAITSGTFADARIAASNVTQHQASLSLATSQITSGTMANARIAESNVTQHEDALTLDSSQLANLTISTSDPSGGTNGDLWFKREA